MIKSDNKKGKRIFQRRNKVSHWLPGKTRTSPCGQLDLDYHKCEQVQTIAGFLPGNLCQLCRQAMKRAVPCR